jgi:hypothetical protein
MYMHVKALEYMIQSNTLPCNVKFMIEGEEGGHKSCEWVRATKRVSKATSF